MKINKPLAHKLFTLAMLFAGLMTVGCSNDKVKNEAPYDPSHPVKITDFEPHDVNARTRMLIYGENFGNDKSLLKLKVGGVETKIINCNNNCIYCMVPPRAFDGTIELKIGEQSASSPEKYNYKTSTQVKTLCGTVDGTGRYEIKDGPFSECGVGDPYWMSIDPKNHNHIYFIENKSSIRLIDMEKQEVSTLITVGDMNIARPESIEWSVNADTMFVSNWQDNSNNPISISALLRSEDFKRSHAILTGFKFLYSAVPHPQNGEIYFSEESGGSIYRFVPGSGKAPEEIIKFGASWVWLKIFFHPSGDYAYVVRVREQQVYKCIYNRKTRTLENPTLLVGNGFGRVEGSGTNVRFALPWQGVFVKNNSYVQNGNEELYDFYLADPSHIYYGDGQGYGNVIWKITSLGTATIYAGLGSTGLDGNDYGYVDGDLRKEARFNRPYALAYDEQTMTFYIGDKGNHRIRLITIE